jgi:L-lactate utilization protein LutC
MVVSLKRTLRERWTEVEKELHSLNSPNVYLFTADQAFSQQTAEAVRKSNIHLVVWDELKTERFSRQNVVIGYSEWARKRLPHLQKRWKAPKRRS